LHNSFLADNDKTWTVNFSRFRHCFERERAKQLVTANDFRQFPVCPMPTPFSTCASFFYIQHCYKYISPEMATLGQNQNGKAHAKKAKAALWGALDAQGKRLRISNTQMSAKMPTNVVFRYFCQKSIAHSARMLYV